ncbi:MAG: MlaD family protein [Acidobacteriaceae bacterium]|jgi:phospholipid/cholesterol/gamma-HCH transport system substrate-binding protein
MPSQQEVRWSQLKIGVIVLVSAVILTTLLFLMTSASGLGLFSRKLTVTSYFANAGGLKVGAAVDLEGYTIGNVKTISVVTTPERKLTPVQVVMKIDGKYQPSLHTDSTAALSTVGILGDTVVDINSRMATGPMLQDGDELKAKEERTIQEIEDQGEAALDQFSVMLTKANTIVDNLQAGKGTIGQFMTNPDVYNKLNATMDEIHQLTVKMNSNDNTAGKFFNDHAEMYDKMNDIVAKVDDITNDLQNGKGNLGKVLKDESAYNNANESLKNLNAILADAQAGKGAAGMLLKDPATAKKLDDTLTKLDDLLTGIDEGKGTVGKLFKDDTTSTNFNNLLTNSSDLVTAIRQDPKKYLSIKLHIF